MADISDVLNALATMIATSLYPNGIADGQGNAILSTAGPVVKIMLGSPFALQLDDDLRAGVVNITVNERRGVGRTTTRFPLEWTINSVASATTSANVADNVLTLGGTVSAGQGILIIVDGQPYAYRCQALDTLTSVAAALAALVEINRPALAIGGALTIPGARQITIREVLPGTAIQPTRQQTAGIVVRIFAPSFSSRDLVAKLVDGYLSSVSRINLIDGSVAMLRYSGTTYDDKTQKALTFIRNILYQVEYSTTQMANETTIGVMESVLTPGAVGGVPGPIRLITDVGPAIAPLPSDLDVIVLNGEISVDSFGNPEVAI